MSQGWRALPASLMSFALFSSAALADEYPAALDPSSLAAWVRSIGIAPEQVVAFTPFAAIAIVSKKPPPASRGAVTLRAEVLSQEARARTGFVMWETRLAVDCPSHRVRVGGTTAYGDRGPKAAALQLGPGDADWRAPPTGSALDAAWRAVCDPAFQPPLAPSATRAKAPVLPRAPALRVEVARTAPTLAARPAAPAVAAGSAQVVSSPSADDTRRRLDQLRSRFGDAFGGRTSQVQPAQVAGRTVYRGLVVGFPSRRDAAGFCRALKAGGQDCLVR